MNNKGDEALVLLFIVWIVVGAFYNATLLPLGTAVAGLILGKILYEPQVMVDNDDDLEGFLTSISEEYVPETPES